MKDHCNHCELEQLRKIVKDAVQYAHHSLSKDEETDGLIEILERPIQPSTVMFEEDEDGVFHQQ
jgi:hypothetical protein